VNANLLGREKEIKKPDVPEIHRDSSYVDNADEETSAIS